MAGKVCIDLFALFMPATKFKEVIMKIKVKYDESEQTEYLCGNFVFIRDGNKVRNLEGVW